MEGRGSKIRFSAYRRLGDIIFLVLDYGLFRSQVPLTETNHVNCDWTPFMERHIFDSITTAGLCIDANIRARMFTRAIQTVTYSDAEKYALLRFSCSFLVLALMLTDCLQLCIFTCWQASFWRMRLSYPVIVGNTPLKCFQKEVHLAFAACLRAAPSNN